MRRSNLQVPTDDPGHKLAASCISVCVSTSGDWDETRHLCIRQSCKSCNDRGDDKGDGDSRSSLVVGHHTLRKTKQNEVNNQTPKRTFKLAFLPPRWGQVDERALPVNTKIPVPMIAPTPIAVKSLAVKTRFIWDVSDSWSSEAKVRVLVRRRTCQVKADSPSLRRCRVPSPMSLKVPSVTSSCPTMFAVVGGEGKECGGRAGWGGGGRGRKGMIIVHKGRGRNIYKAKPKTKGVGAGWGGDRGFYTFAQGGWVSHTSSSHQVY